MDQLLEGKVALVTGGSSGIGEAAARVFAREGAAVVIADQEAHKGDLLARMLREAGEDALFVKCDVSKADEVESMVEETIRRFGRLDCAFNNAGIEGEEATIVEMPESNWDRIISVNLTGVWLCMKYELREMVSRRSGAIVNNSSVAGLSGFAGFSPYAASKHGVIGMTRSAAMEYAKSGVRINAVCPGIVHTSMIERITRGDPEIESRYAAMEPLGRMARPDEIAEAVLWLCSDKASFVTGDAMVVDGGMLAG